MLTTPIPGIHQHATVLWINGRPHVKVKYISTTMRKDLDVKTVKADTGCRRCFGRIFTGKNLTTGVPVLCNCAVIEITGPGTPEPERSADA